MEKESYNIDDILSEVKKHREEQEQQLKAEPASQADAPEISVKDDESNFSILEIDEDEKNLLDEQAEEVDENAGNINESEKNFVIEDKEPEPDEEKETQAEEKKTDSAENSDSASTDAETQTDDIGAEADDDGMVDILQIASEPEALDEKEIAVEKQKFFKTKKGKIVKNIILFVLIILVIACIAAVVFVNNMLNNVSDNDDEEEYEAVTYYDGMDFLQEDFPLIEEMSAYDVYSYKEYLKSWYYNGDPVRSSHVLNVLLIGEDTREETISDTSRADSAIIASINIDTGTIHLTSVLRDLYVYYEVDGEGYYGKINESASYGGISTYITTLERTYKLAIDGYAVVNFASFPKIVDALGGVEINITSAEISEINNNPYVYGDVGEVYIEKTFDGDEGVMKLDGIQALAYCRIRHIDSDSARADRQKYVLSEILNKVKTSSTWDAVKVVNQFSKYTKTSYSKKELISIGNLAIRDGWLNYTVETKNIPAAENSEGGQYFSVSYNNWIWIADIPKDAYELQLSIYGKSNIQLNENRPDYIALGK